MNDEKPQAVWTERIRHGKYGVKHFFTKRLSPGRLRYIYTNPDQDDLTKIRVHLKPTLLTPKI